MNKESLEFISALKQEFEGAKNERIALGQKRYLKDQFEFLGISTPLRRELQQAFLDKKHLPQKEEGLRLVKSIWVLGKREYQYFAQELCFKYVKQFEEKDLELLEWLVMHDSWWDTVDFIATKLLGSYFTSFPHKRDETIQKWIDSNHLWLKRSAILFQLKYKEKFDTEFLDKVITQIIPTKEFFLNKAIGWALREHAKLDPEWVKNYVQQKPLSTLSKREALKHL